MATFDCSICLESFRVDSGGSDCAATSKSVCCKAGHHICESDLQRFCQENFLGQPFLVRKTLGRLPCPAEQCQLTFDPIDVHKLLPVTVQLRFINTVRELNLLEENSVLRSVVHGVRDCCTLKCPSCDIAVDPEPDACSAVKCLVCGHYYCNFCFQGFQDAYESGNGSPPASDARAAAHIHAATHNSSSSNAGENASAFLSTHEVQRGQRQVRTLAIVRFLRGQLGSEEHLVKLALLSLQSELNDMSIDILDVAHFVWQRQTTNDKNITLTTTNEHKTDVSSTLQEKIREKSLSESLRKEERANAQILARSMLSENQTAIRQVLSLLTSAAGGCRLELNFEYTEASTGNPVTRSLLAHSVLLGCDEVARFLLEQGADPLKLGSDGRSAVFLMIERGCLDLLLVLQKVHPAFDWNAPLATESQNMYYHALIIAIAYHQSTSVLPFLLSRTGIKVDFRTRSFSSVASLVGVPGCTALFFACEQCSEAACRLLLSHGARCDLLCSIIKYIACPNGQVALAAPLQVAIEKDMNAIALQMIDQLITSYTSTLAVHPFEVILEMPQRRSLLQVLAMTKSSTLMHSVLRLLPAGHCCRPSQTALDYRDAEQRTALDIAVLMENAMNVELLLLIGCDPQSDILSPPAPIDVHRGNCIFAAKTPEGNVPGCIRYQGRLTMFYAVERGSIACIDALLRYAPVILTYPCDLSPGVTNASPVLVAKLFKQPVALQFLLEHYAQQQKTLDARHVCELLASCVGVAPAETAGQAPVNGDADRRARAELQRSTDVYWQLLLLHCVGSSAVSIKSCNGEELGQKSPSTASPAPLTLPPLQRRSSWLPFPLKSPHLTSKSPSSTSHPITPKSPASSIHLLHRDSGLREILVQHCLSRDAAQKLQLLVHIVFLPEEEGYRGDGEDLSGAQELRSICRLRSMYLPMPAQVVDVPGGAEHLVLHASPALRLCLFADAVHCLAYLLRPELDALAHLNTCTDPVQQAQVVAHFLGMKGVEGGLKFVRMRLEEVYAVAQRCGAKRCAVFVRSHLL